MTDGRTSTSTDDGAIAAAADRYVQQHRAQRIATAEQAHRQAVQRLANAQAAYTEASARVAQYEGGGNVRDLQGAEREVTLATAIVGHRERELGTAKRRTTTAEREAATELVTAERTLASLADTRLQAQAAVAAAVAPLLAAVRKLRDVTAAANFTRFDLGDARERLGLPSLYDHDHVVPDPTRLAGGAIADACRAAGFSPFDFRDLATAAAATYVKPLPDVAHPAPDGAEAGRKSREWQASLHAQADANDRSNVAELHATGRVTGLGFGSRVTDGEAAE